jgi:hypothetical protein
MPSFFNMAVASPKMALASAPEITLLVTRRSKSAPMMATLAYPNSCAPAVFIDLAPICGSGRQEAIRRLAEGAGPRVNRGSKDTQLRNLKSRGTNFELVAFMPECHPNVIRHKKGARLTEERTMTTLQAFLLGMMVAWTPSLVLLGWFLLLEDRQKGVTEEPA